MIEGLLPYPEMQSTGHPWLPSIPTHWEVRRNGRLFSERRETGYPDLPILEVSLRSGVRIRDMEGGKRKQQIADRSVYQRAVKGDIAYNMMRMWQGAVGIAPTDGLVSPAYVVAKAHDPVDAAYYALLFRTDDYMKEIDSYSRGIVPDRNRLYWQAFKQMPSAYPPLDEQRLIVRFLDWHGAMTGKLIRAKRRLIALLNEQKKSIIHRAVTRGLDPAAKLKPSGNPLIGEVVDGWVIRRLRNVADLRVSNVDKKEHEGELPVRLCNYVDVYRNEEIGPDIPFMEATATPFEVERFRLKVGDVIITKDSEDWKDIGVPALVATEADDLVCAYHLAMLRPFPDRIEGAFLFWQLMGWAARWSFAMQASGVTRFGLSQGAIKGLPLVIPPLDQQRQIVAHLIEETADIRRGVKDALDEIALIHEFRTRLIADVVTGQLDVRAIAANLPDVTEIDTAGDLTVEDDMDDDADDVIVEEEAA